MSIYTLQSKMQRAVLGYMEYKTIINTFYYLYYTPA